MSYQHQRHSADIGNTTEDVRVHISQFRVLIVGRAKSGKTTLLQRILHGNDSGSPLAYRRVDYVDHDGETAYRLEKVDPKSVVNFVSRSYSLR
jgi:GTPase SAR1 family protein